MIEIRLQKFIADCGYTSRRKAEDLIIQGRVSLNGEVVTQLGTKVNPDNDVVFVDGQVLESSSVSKLYILMNKPRGYVTTVTDPEGRKTVMDLCKGISERIYPVGRLDYLSEGLLLLTNDGQIANMVMHPRYNVVKVYEVKVFGAVTDTILKRLREGVKLEYGFVKPLSVRIIKQLPSKTWLEIRLGEGKNREIRKICETCGITVDKLKRMAIGGLTVDGIKPGSWRMLSKKQLLESLGMNEDGSLKNDTQYFSSKKSISLKKRGSQKATSADDRTFGKFRRENYFETLTAIKESKEEVAKKEATLDYEAQAQIREQRAEERKGRSDFKYKKYRKRR